MLSSFKYIYVSTTRGISNTPILRGTRRVWAGRCSPGHYCLSSTWSMNLWFISCRQSSTIENHWRKLRVVMYPNASHWWAVLICRNTRPPELGQICGEASRIHKMHIVPERTTANLNSKALFSIATHQGRWTSGAGPTRCGRHKRSQRTRLWVLVGPEARAWEFGCD